MVARIRRAGFLSFAAILLALAASAAAVDGIAPVITLPSDVISGSADVSSGASADVHLTVADMAGDLHWYNTSGNPYTWIAFDETGTVTNPPAGVANAGIAVTETYQNAAGTWQWSSDGGASWTDFSATPASAVLLPAQAGWLVRFRANAEARTGDGAALYFRAWDGSVGSPGGTADAQYPGSPSAFSAERREVAVTVIASPRAPVLLGGSPEIAGLWSGYGAVRSRDVQVGDLIAGYVDDYDGDTVGMAIIAANTDDGTWEYASDSTFADAQTISLGAEDTLYLDATDWLRFTPAPYGFNLTIFGGLTFRAWDGDLESDASTGVDLRFSNDAPTIDSFGVGDSITSPPPQTPEATVAALGSVTFTLAASDADGDTLAWEYDPVGGDVIIDGDFDVLQRAYSNQTVGDAAAYGTVTLTDDDQGGLTVTYTNTDGTAAEDAINLYVYDSFGETAYITVRIAIDGNDAPTIISPVPASLAVAGQEWRFILAASDDDAGDTLTPSLSGAPSWLSGQRNLAARRWELYGTPPAAAALSSFSVVVSDGNGGSASISVSVEVIAAESVPIEVTVPEVSSAAAPRYGAIAPGSRAGFEAVNSAFGDLFTDRARGLWWQAGYVDLPQIPSAPERAGVFLATTVERTLTVPAAPRQPAPFAIPLANGASTAGKWSFIGIPPLALSAGQSGGVTSHAWADFRLEDADGNPITDASTIVGALATGSGADDERIKPYTWNGSAYVRADTLVSGTAYWVANFSGQAYRLVRTGGGSTNGRFGAISFSAQGGAARASAGTSAAVDTSGRSGPPAPPGGSASAAATATDGGCGGGLAGLLLAGLALVGLRPRRRG